MGILLFNLGGPERLADVRPFLYNLFSDPDIIRLPIRALQKPLAWLISTARYKKSSGYYEQIGGGSPLRKITVEQADALQTELADRGIAVRVYVGMRYWPPFIEDALERVWEDRITDLVVLPLYPQFSISTTGSSLNRLSQLMQANGGTAPRIIAVNNWHDDLGYIGVLKESVKEELVKFSDPDPRNTHIVFSAHSVPVRYIEEGDPYLAQIRRTVELVMARLGPERPHSLAFQSKVGPVKWLGPSTDQALRKLAAEACSQVLVVPVSFVSEHIETLYELDILYQGVAAEAGIGEYRRVPAFNCRPDFIGVLADLVQRAIQS